MYAVLANENPLVPWIAFWQSSQHIGQLTQPLPNPAHQRSATSGLLEAANLAAKKPAASAHSLHCGSPEHVPTMHGDKEAFDFIVGLPHNPSVQSHVLS